MNEQHRERRSSSVVLAENTAWSIQIYTCIYTCTYSMLRSGQSSDPISRLSDGSTFALFLAIHWLPASASSSFVPELGPCSRPGCTTSESEGGEKTRKLVEALRGSPKLTHAPTIHGGTCSCMLGKYEAPSSGVVCCLVAILDADDNVDTLTCSLRYS